MNYKNEILKLLLLMREEKASDLHISSNWSPVLRINGSLVTKNDFYYSKKQLSEMLDTIINTEQKELYLKAGNLDFGFSDDNNERYRFNVYREMGKTTMAIRHLDNSFKKIDELSLPQSINQLTKMKAGLILVCGATGSGKSTTLASILNDINTYRDAHIITIEDPVEFVYENKKGLVHQRELHSDVETFASAVRASLREDPDVIMVGEMRDLETIRAAITAAETGHLVLSTLHTADAVGVVERLIGSFPGDEQTVARHRISLALKAVVAQQLVPNESGTKRLPVVEILMNNQAVSNLIISNKTKQIYSMIEGGRSEGMQTFDQSLVELVSNRQLERQVADKICHHPDNLKKLFQNVHNTRAVSHSATTHNRSAQSRT